MPLTTEDRFWAKVDRQSSPHGCWLWTGCLARGYGQFSAPSRRHVYAHRFAWEITGHQPADGLELLHDCPGGDNRRCVNPEHLRPGTRAENVADAVRKGRQAKGEGHGLAKLCAEHVRAIRALVADGATLGSVAAEFGVSSVTIHHVAHGHTWRHVAGYR